MNESTDQKLSRRERQIMNILHARSRASAAEVLEALNDPPSYSAVRALLRVLVEKGHAQFKEVNGKYIYMPTQSRRSAARAALKQVLQTYYEDSTFKTMAALLDMSGDRLEDADLERLSKMIEDARKEGR